MKINTLKKFTGATILFLFLLHFQLVSFYSFTASIITKMRLLTHLALSRPKFASTEFLMRCKKFCKIGKRAQSRVKCYITSKKGIILKRSA